jgi:hypothetical protein
VTGMDPERRRRLVALGDAHRQWVEGALPEAEFQPDSRPAGSDYQQHYADLEATPKDEDAFHRRAGKIMGLDPATGDRVADE